MARNRIGIEEGLGDLVDGLFEVAGQTGGDDHLHDGLLPWLYLVGLLTGGRRAAAAA